MKSIPPNQRREFLLDVIKTLFIELGLQYSVNPQFNNITRFVYFQSVKNTVFFVLIISQLDEFVDNIFPYINLRDITMFPKKSNDPINYAFDVERYKVLNDAPALVLFCFINDVLNESEMRTDEYLKSAQFIISENLLNLLKSKSGSSFWKSFDNRIVMKKFLGSLLENVWNQIDILYKSEPVVQKVVDLLSKKYKFKNDRSMNKLKKSKIRKKKEREEIKDEETETEDDDETETEDEDKPVGKSKSRFSSLLKPNFSKRDIDNNNNSYDLTSKINIKSNKNPTYDFQLSHIFPRMFSKSHHVNLIKQIFTKNV